MVRQVKSWETCVLLGMAVVAVVVTGNLPAKAVPVASAPASTAASCRSTSSVPPTSAQIEALQALVLKYKATTSNIVNKTSITRCQFASLLNSLLEQVNEMLAAGNIEPVAKADLSTFYQLQEAYAVELSSLPKSESLRETQMAVLDIERFPISKKLGGEWILEPQFNELPLPPLPPLPSNGNAPAAPTDVQALDALTERHGCIVGYPDLRRRAYQLSRFEFAAALNACIDRVEQLMAGGNAVSQADLSTLHRLEAAYAGELAYLRGRVAQLEERTRRQEQQQAFQADLLATLKLSSTIKLSSEFLFKPQPFHIRTEPTPPPAPPNAGTPAALADFQAFAPVVQRYGCVVGFFDQFSDKLTRIEFAAALNNCVDRVNDLVISGSVVRQEDLLTLKRLEASYSGELAVLRFRIDALEARIKKQEQQPFSPTTKLHVETILELSGTAGGNR